MTSKIMEDTEPCVLCGNDPEECVCMPEDISDMDDLDALADEADWNYYEEMSILHKKTYDAVL